MDDRLKLIPGEKLAKLIDDDLPEEEIHKTFTFVHMGQTPNVALYIKSGKYTIGAKEYLVLKTESGHLLAFSELLEGVSCDFDIAVKKGAVVLIIDKKFASIINKFDCTEKKMVKT